MPDVSLRTFPESTSEALAMLYLQSQNLTGKTPEEICEMYWDAYYRIYRCNRDARNAARLKTE